MKRAARLVIRLALVALMIAPPVGAEVRMSIEEGRQFALALSQQGRPTAARAAALALLTANPDDVVALIVLSRSERDLGNYPAAQKAARHAWSKAEPGIQRFGAALAMAQALSSDGARTRAQLWLRRAVQAAPDDRSRALAARDFAYVRQKNPLTARLSFGAFPSSNVNDGPTTNTLIIGDMEFVNPDAVPLSGVGLTSSADLSWRIDTGETTALTLGMMASATRYTLSQAAKDKVPDADAGDYATSTLAASAGWAWQRDGKGWGAELTLGRDWQGGAAQENWQQLAFTHSRSLDEGRRLDIGLTLQNSDRLDTPLRSADRVGLRLGWGWQTGNGDRLRSSLRVERVMSDAAAVARQEGMLRLDWSRAEPVLGLALSGHASLGISLYDRPLYLTERRRDVTAELGLTAVIPKLDYMGFAPELGLTLRQVDSNISAMTTEKAELRFGIRSLF